jgi:hypothetical protein
MFNSWTFYLILGLSATTLSLGWLSLSLHDDKVIAEQALVHAINVNTDMQKSLNLKDLSCKIDDDSVVEVESEKKILKDKIDVINDNIEKLRLPKGNPSVAAKQENIKNENLKPNVLPDDGLLSPNIVGLLKQGYCTTYPNDSECLPK